MYTMGTLLAVLLLFPVAGFAQTSTALGCQEARTEFHDVSGFGRKDTAARNMTKRHTELAAKGWRFVDMEVYTENNDLEGFYVSYVRPTACGTTSE